MITRYVITLGAATTSGGKVTSGTAGDTVDGVPLACEGDRCWCPDCRSEGVIGLDGPRLSETAGGREVALSGDLCLCRCDPPPRLLPAQRLVAQSVADD